MKSFAKNANFGINLCRNVNKDIQIIATLSNKLNKKAVLHCEEAAVALQGDTQSILQ